MEKQLQPKLRFSEFNEDWRNIILKDISLKIKDGTHFSPKTFKEGDYKYLTSKNVKNGYLDFTNLEYINKEDHFKIYSSSDVKYGDILLTKDGTIGQCCVNTLKEEFSLLSSVAFIRVKDDFYNYFIYQLLVSSIGQREIEKAIAGQALKRITLTKINDFKFNLPSLPEQQKIADYLSTIDSKINLLEEKKTELSRYKKAMMQKLFSQEIRFKDENGNDFSDWEEKRLGDVFNSYNGLTGKTKENFGFGKPYIKYTQVFNDSKINIQNFDFVEITENDNQNSVEFGDALFTVSSETPHEVGMSSVLLDSVEDVYLNSFCFGIRLISKNLNPYYYRYFFRSKNFRKEVIKLAQGSTRYNMSKIEFMKINIQIPSLPEQQKIADFLSAIDESIDKVSEQIKETQSFKKAMLQQMFV